MQKYNFFCKERLSDRRKAMIPCAGVRQIGVGAFGEESWNGYLCGKIVTKMNYKELSLPGVWLIEPRRIGDARGYFMESFKLEEFRRNVGDVRFVQDNESLSTKGVLRGLHFQKGEHSQAKLVRVSAGSVLDVVVDLRGDSPTFGQHVAVELSAENALQLYIPRGMAHGFVVLSDMAQFQYKVDNEYAPESEATLRFDDPELGIDWRFPREALTLSPKDLRGTPFAEITHF